MLSSFPARILITAAKHTRIKQCVGTHDRIEKRLRDVSIANINNVLRPPGYAAASRACSSSQCISSECVLGYCEAVQQ